MKVIFLDIDGVLNSAGFLKEQETETPNSEEERNLLLEIEQNPDNTSILRSFDPKKIENLNKLIDATGCQVVISSSWRSCLNHQQLEKVLRFHGFRHTVLGETPQLGRFGRNRGHEIQAWLDQNKNVEKFVILDDNDDMGRLRSFLVRTSFKTGLLKKHVEKAIQIVT